MNPGLPITRRNILKAAGGAAVAVATMDPTHGAGSLSGGTVTAVTLIHGLPGKEQDLKSHLLSLASPTRAESGCLTYDLYESPERPQEFMRFERWASAAALEAHKQMPYLRASFEKRQREGWTTEILTWRRVMEDVS